MQVSRYAHHVTGLANQQTTQTAAVGPLHTNMFALLKETLGTASSIEPIQWQQTVISDSVPAQQPQEPSFLDRLAAPTVFLQQALVFPDTALDPESLKAAVEAVLQLYPPVGHRLSSSQDGQLITVPASSAGSRGIGFLLAPSRSLTLQQLLQHNSIQQQQQQQQQQQCLPELPDLMFGHLPGSLTPDYVDSDLPLVHVALLQLAGGGSVLGVRMSHLLGDWASLRLLLRALAAAYTSRSAAQAGLPQQQQQQQSVLPALVPAAPLLNQLAAAVLQQQQTAVTDTPYCPLRLKSLEQADTDTFTQLAALTSSSSGDGGNSGSSQRPVRLSYHVAPARVQQLKQQLLAEAGAGSSSSWCSAHNAVLASVLKAFGSLPGRQGLPHDVSVAADMRGRLPAKQVQLLGQQQMQQQQLHTAVGNFFASAIAEDCVAQQCSRAQLAQALHAAVPRAAEVWLPDLAWAAGFKGMTAAAGTDPSEAAVTADATGAAGSTAHGVAVGEVTWRRLHAMGPVALLQRQMALGLLASLSTTQWLLDYASDAAFAGVLPCMSVPSFSQPQPYPLVLTQQATPAQGGGWMVHLFLDAAEAPALQDAVAAQGGL